MNNAVKKWIIVPTVFLIVYLLGNLIGVAIYVVHFQIANEGGSAPTEPGGWLTTIIFCTVLVMFNLCGLNQVLFLPFCLLPKLRQMVGFRFALLSGVLFGFAPPTVRNILRHLTGYRIEMMNETTTEYALCWIIFGLLFLGLTWLSARFFARRKET